MSHSVFLGIDIGTSGIRASCINSDQEELLSFQIDLTGNHADGFKNQQDPNIWTARLDNLLTETTSRLQRLNALLQVCAISIDGTSSTLIACKKDGTAVSPAMMYNDQQSQQQAELIKQKAPAESAVHGASSSLAKALFLLQKYPETELFCHQADWLAASLSGQYGISDENNCLKLGFDSITQSWPDWLLQILPAHLLPKVVPPGTVIGRVLPELVKKYGLADNCRVVAGTTDSNAAVLATGANQLGDAVTSLGSTLVIKLFSDRPVFSPEFGIYSHRLNGHWLVGGASNSGAAVLLQQFTRKQLEEMTPLLQPEHTTGLDYYPLPGIGERFPVNDRLKKSQLEPRPLSDVTFFQAILEGIASIEADGYKKMLELGAARPRRIFTAGGGSCNMAWNKIREQITGIRVITATHTEASYGSALLARQGYLN